MGGHAVPESRFWSVFQIILLLATIEGALWSEAPTQGYWYVAGVVVLLGCVLLSHPRLRPLGIGLRGMWGAAWVIPLALAICTVVIIAAAKLGTLKLLYGPKPVYWHSIFYAIWALEQQFMLNSFFYKRFEHLLGDSTATVVATALLFSLVHIPNPVLVPATFLGGLLFVETFRRWRNIYPLAIAHAMFGLTLAITVPDEWIRHMRVGLGYLRFHMHA